MYYDIFIICYVDLKTINDWQAALYCQTGNKGRVNPRYGIKFDGCYGKCDNNGNNDMSA